MHPLSDERGTRAEEHPLPSRLTREIKTITVMIDMYCKAHHRGDLPPRKSRAESKLCPACAELLQYSTLRIRSCRFQAAKPTCAGCTVHCFKDSMKRQIKDVMRHSGPRMLLRHPYLTLRHVIDSRRTGPAQTAG